VSTDRSNHPERDWHSELLDDFGTVSNALDDTLRDEIPPRISDWMNQVPIGGPLLRAIAEFALTAETSPTHRRWLGDGQYTAPVNFGWLTLTQLA
jgi:hypothetical protein